MASAVTEAPDIYVGDGGESADREKEQNFVRWLQDHGALFDAVQWPSRQLGPGGLRQAVALRDIEPGEHMVVVPHRLMLSQLHAKADPQHGHVHRANEPILKGDNGLALYIMQELLKGARSFYWPYLQILPPPRNLRHWTEPRLADLQDSRLARRAAARTQQLRTLYRDTVDLISAKYPDLYSPDRYTFELFDFAWSTLQARAFGKRLKCSALVPFADCLNHGNLQTKYDFDVASNGFFRLFPSGSNRYAKGTEVLNSYGRRANDHLLLEYGFAMLDNEWDEAEISCSLAPHDLLFERRKACLRASGLHTICTFRLRRQIWPVRLLQFQRCACLSATDFVVLEGRRERRAGRPRLQPLNEQAGNTTEHEDSYAPRHAATLVNRLPSIAASAKACVRDGCKKVFDDSSDSLCHARVSGRAYIQSCGRDSAREFPFRALSPENELSALTEVVVHLLEAQDAFPTTLESDEALLQQVCPDAAPELANAVRYRVTTKRILAEHLRLFEQAIACVQDMATKLEEDEASDSVRNATSSRNGIAKSCAEQATSALPPSFVAYLEELRDTFLLEQTTSPKDPANGEDENCSSWRPRHKVVPTLPRKEVMGDLAAEGGNAPRTCGRSTAESHAPPAVAVTGAAAATPGSSLSV